MISIELALSVLLAFQQEGWQETTFHRIYLRNGNFIDGRVISDKPNEVILLMKAGEMAIRRDQVDKVELMKLKSYNDKPIILATPKGAPVGDPTKPVKPTPDTPVPAVDTPEAIRKRVDMIMFKFKNNPSGENEIPFQEIAALGEDASVYLASRIPAFDEKSQTAIGVCLIQLHQLRASEKVRSILDGLTSNASVNVRMVAVTVLGATTDDDGKLKYLRTAIQDPEAKVRVTALSAVGNVESREWYEPIKDLCSDVNTDVRARALRIGKYLADKHGLTENFSQLLLANTRHPDAGVRADSAGVMGLVGVKEQWRGLVGCLGDSEPPVRAAAAQSLMTLGVPESGDDIAAALTREKEHGVLVYLIGAVQRIRIQKATEPLIRLLDTQDQEIKRLAHGALRTLTGQAFDADPAAWNSWFETNRPK